LLAELARQGRVELVWSMDLAWEFSALPNRDSPDGLFFGAPLSWVQVPITWGAYMSAPRMDGVAHKRQWLSSISDSDFVRLRKLVGAQPQSHRFQNQLMDAVHLWCAEHHAIPYFLTSDYTLARTVAAHRPLATSVRILSPIELVAELVGQRVLRPRDLRQDRHRMWQQLKNPPVGSGIEELAALGDRLERQGYYDPRNDPPSS
jgi:hypothetical protein